MPARRATVLPSGVTLQRRDPPDPLPASFGQPLPDPVLERIAVRWAELRGIPPADVVLREEDLGWAVWAPGHRTAYATFVDKVTGREVDHPHPADPDQRYARQLAAEDGHVPRPGFGGVPADPPAVTAEVILTGDHGHHPAGRAVSSRTGEPPVLHPVVAARLAAVPARARVRGAERHAELAALGAAVTAADAARARDGRPAITDADLGGPGLRTLVVRTRLRDPGDPLAGRSAADPCATCARVLGVPYQQDRVSPAGRLAAYARLRAPSRDPAADVVARVAAAGHPVFPAAVRAVERHLGAAWDIDAPGLAVRTTRFVIDPPAAAESAATLARVAARVGASLFPVGVAGTDGLLAVAGDGRVFLVDEAGEWLLGGGMRAALGTLAWGRTGRRVP
jgi:hypothetical protein